MEDIEEWEDIPAYGKAKAEPDDAVPFEQAVRQIKGAAHPTRCSRGFRVVFACTEGERRIATTGFGSRESPQVRSTQGNTCDIPNGTNLSMAV